MHAINLKQKILLVITCLLFVSAGVYPSWIEKEEWHDRERTEIHHLGRHLILDPPYKRSTLDFLSKNQFINTTNLFIEWSIIIVPTIVLFFVFKNPKE